MKRSEFLQYLGSGGAGLFVPLPLMEGQYEQVTLYDNYLRGTHYYDYYSVKKGMRLGDSLELKRDRENVHDTFAIRVYWKEYLLGYVAAYENIVLANLLDAGLSLYATISALDPRRTNEEVAARIALSLPLKLLHTLGNWKPSGRADDAVDVYRAGKTVII